MTAYRYRAYGLGIHSDFELPELGAVDDAQQDVSVILGELPKEATPLSVAGLWESDQNGDRLYVEGVAGYLASRGRQIVVDPAPGADMRDVRAHLLSSLLAAILHQRQMLVLHASAVATADGAVLFAGQSGAGKSTMLAGFVDRGHALLADDKAVIVFDEHGVPFVQPGGPNMRLTPATVRALRLQTEEGPVAHFLDKHVIAAGRHSTTPAVVRTVYLLESGGDGADVTVTTLPQLDAFEALVAHTYRKRLLRHVTQRQSHFAAIGRLARQCRVARVLRPRVRPPVCRVLDQIEEAWYA